MSGGWICPELVDFLTAEWGTRSLHREKSFRDEEKQQRIITGKNHLGMMRNNKESRIKICTHYILAHSDLISLYFVVQQFFDQKNLFIQADYNCLKVLKLDICLGLLKRPFNRRSKVPDRFIALKTASNLWLTGKKITCSWFGERCQLIFFQPIQSQIYDFYMIMLRSIWKGTTDDTTPYFYLEVVKVTN